MNRFPTCLGLLVALAPLWSPPAASMSLTIEHVTVIDGTGRAAQKDMTVVMNDGRFQQVVPSALQGPPVGRRIDGRGKFLMPGLMDMHIHLRGGTVISADGITKTLANPEQGHAEGLAALQSFLYCGVTSVFDAGNVPDFIFGLRDEERSGKILAPRIFAAGGIVTAPGSHGSGNGSVDIEGWPGAKPALDALFARHPDLIKFTLEERGWGARPMIPLLDVALMEHAIEYANDHGIRTTIHISSELRAREAIFAGADNLAHPPVQGPVSDSFVRLMGAKRVPMVTTLTIGENYSRLVEHPEYLDQPWYRAALGTTEIESLKTKKREEYSKSLWTGYWKLMTPQAEENVRKLHEGGATLVLGTDQTSGPATHREMELLAAAGIPPAAIVRIATLNAAIFLGRERDLGSIEAGKLADALLLDGDPTASVENMQKIRLVVKNGEIVDESRLQLAGGKVARRYNP
ncbi:MAG: amidohydrolase family protein [Steroidobacterales bacterium]